MAKTTCHQCQKTSLKASQKIYSQTGCLELACFAPVISSSELVCCWNMTLAGACCSREWGLSFICHFSILDRRYWYRFVGVIASR
jgi:hypothetical protein